MLHPFRSQLVAVAAALALASVLVTGASAGKGGAGGSQSSPSLNVVWPFAGANTSGATTPFPFVLSGCGYSAANGGVTVVLHSPTATSFGGQTPDANGCITLTNWTTQGFGVYRADAFQSGKKSVASTSFSVS